MPRKHAIRQYMDSSNEEEPAWCNGAGADRTLGVAKFCIAWRKFCMGGTRLINLRPLKYVFRGQ